MSPKSCSATLRRYPLTLLCVLLIAFLSLVWAPERPPMLESVQLIDKWVHMLMYGGTMGMWRWENRRQRPTPARIAWAWVALTAYGGLIEIAQGTLTTTRSADWIDWLADGLGALAGWALAEGVVLSLARRWERQSPTSSRR